MVNFLTFESTSDFVAYLSLKADAGPHKQMQYIQIIITVMVLFLFLYGALDYVLSRCFTEFKILHGKKRVEYVARVIAIIHATVVTIIAYFGCFHYCDDPTKTIFTDRQCYLTPKNLHVIST